MSQHKTSLYQSIYRLYIKTTLIPILAIELLILFAYSSVSLYISIQSSRVLQREIKAVISPNARMHSDLISAELDAIDHAAAYFASEHEALFANPGSRPISGEEPLFAIAPTDALYQVNREEGSSLYFSRAGGLTASQRAKARFTAGLDPLYRHMVEKVPNVTAAYLNTPDDMNRIYPFIPEIWRQYPPILNTKDFNFFYLADADHNPDRKPVWTGVYLDPAGRGWMLSCVAPVYRAEELMGVVGLDITTTTIIERILSQKLPWGATTFLADEAGMILAMTPQAEEVLGLAELKSHVYGQSMTQERLKPEEYSLLKSRDQGIAEAFGRFYAATWTKDPGEEPTAGPGTIVSDPANPPLDTDALVEISTASGGLFVAGKRIASTGWRLFMLIERRKVLASVNEISKVMTAIGLVLAIFMASSLLWLFLRLRSGSRYMSAAIAEPVSRLSTAAHELSGGKEWTDLQDSGILELDALSSTFMKMSRELKSRADALVRSEIQVKIKEKDAELAFAKGMFESANGYLHFVGNAIMNLDGFLQGLGSSMIDLERLSMMAESQDNGGGGASTRPRTESLDRILSQLREGISGMQAVRESIARALRHQQRTCTAGRTEIQPERIDMASLLRQVVAEATEGTAVMVTIEVPTSLEIMHHRNSLRIGVLDLVKNAVEACEARGGGGSVRIALAESASRLTIEVRDDGEGIKREDLPKVMSAGFTTKPTGTGYSLHSFAVFLAANGGKLMIDSPGPGLGAIATVELDHE